MKQACQQLQKATLGSTQSDKLAAAGCHVHTSANFLQYRFRLHASLPLLGCRHSMRLCQRLGFNLLQICACQVRMLLPVSTTVGGLCLSLLLAHLLPHPAGHRLQLCAPWPIYL